MAISTATRRTARSKDIDTQLEDLVIDIEDACLNLPLAEQEKLVKNVRSALSGVTADPAGVASGRTPLSLGAGPVPAPTTPPVIDPVQLITDFATAQGFDPAQISRLLGAIDATDPRTIDDAIKAAQGLMVPSTDLTTATNRANSLATRLGEVETSMSMTAGSLTGPRGLADFNTAKAALTGTPPAPGTPTPAETALKGALDGLNRDRRHPERVKGEIAEAVVATWATERGL